METEILRDIGLTDGEIRVYLAMVKLGPSTTGPIVDSSRVSSSKIYNILERLMQKGLVSFIIKEKTRYYQAEDPVKIQDYISNKEKEIQDQKINVTKLVKELQLQKQQEKSKSEAQIYKGFRGIQTVVDRMYIRLKKGDTFYNIGIPAYQEERYHDYWHQDHLKRIKKDIQCQLLFNINTPQSVLKNRNSYKGCDARYMPIPIETPSWILIYKGVAVIILQSDEPMAIEITNQHIADSFKQYFDAFWKLSKRYG